MPLPLGHAALLLRSAGRRRGYNMISTSRIGSKTQKILSLIDKDGNATICLNRPDVHNALDAEMGAQLVAELGKLEADPKVRAVVLMGQGKNFCAGADIAYMRKVAGFSKAQNHKAALEQAKVYHTLY